MEIGPKQNMTKLEKETTNVSDFINAEQGDLSVPSADSNVNLVDSEQNISDKDSQSVHKDQPSQPVNIDEPEETYQNILGSGVLMKKIIKHGILVDRPTKGEQVVINLVGRLQENNDIIEEEENLEITLGDCEVTLYLKWLINSF